MLNRNQTYGIFSLFSRYSAPPNKRYGLSVSHAKSALTQLAIFHAAGYAHVTGHKDGIKGGLEENAVLVRDYFCNNPLPELAKVHNCNSGIYSGFGFFET